MLKRLHVGAEMKSLYVGVMLVAAVTTVFAYSASRNPDFAMPDPVKVAGLLERQPQCGATVKEMIDKKLIFSVVHDGPTAINATVGSDAWSRLSGPDRSAVALALYCAMMPDDGLFIVVIRDERTTQLVWLMINGKDEASRRELSGD
jgi:hypothetical protein